MSLTFGFKLFWLGHKNVDHGVEQQHTWSTFECMQKNYEFYQGGKKKITRQSMG